jgi:hypothetical protein
MGRPVSRKKTKFPSIDKKWRSILEVNPKIFGKFVISSMKSEYKENCVRHHKKLFLTFIFHISSD